MGLQEGNNRSGPISHDNRNPPEIEHVALMTGMLGFELFFIDSNSP